MVWNASCQFRIAVSSGDMHRLDIDADRCKRYSVSATDFSFPAEFVYSGSREQALREAILPHEGATHPDRDLGESLTT